MVSLFPTSDDSLPTFDPESTMFVRVAIERGLDRADGLSYRSDEPVRVGQRVIVPVGRGNTATGGIVIEAGGMELLNGFDPRKVKPISEITSSGIEPGVVELARWMSKYYLCPLGMVLNSALPSAVKSRTGAKTRIGVQVCVSVPEDAEGVLVGKTKFAWEQICGLADDVFPADPKALRVKLGLSNLTPINRLLKAGFLETVEIQSIRAAEVFDLLEQREDTRPMLNEEQSGVVDGISKTLDAFGVHLVQGVTGSGKTEVYMHLIDRVLARGKTALVLVPEIALTPQTAGRFVSRFGGVGVSVLHSGLSASTRHKQWASARDGQSRVVVGARSAVFAPLSDLGMIVVDEEHDSSYKQDSMPRYNGRDAAVKRAQLEGCPVVLGSATPSLESYANAMDGRYTRWRLATRATGGLMPSVRVIDMERDVHRKLDGKNEALRRKTDAIGPSLHDAIVETIESGSQALLLLNRRGFASVVVSTDPQCGWKLECDQCDATMVVHRGSVRTQSGRRYVRCHHCGSERLIPKSCPMTGKPVVELGAGTQRVEEEIERRYGELLSLREGEGFARVDSDSMRSAKDYFRTLDRFGSGALKMLLGTQMIAKGLDFPNVSLVGVLSADTALYLPDFRAEERTFQLVSQVAGRAGRGSTPGRVLVQTLNPLSPAITLAAEHRYDTFASQELTNRRLAGFPPCTRMARVVIRHKDHARAHAIALQIGDALRRDGVEGVQITGPMECVISKIANQYRWSIELVAPRANLIQLALGRVRAEGLLKSDASCGIDVDPIWLM